MELMERYLHEIGRYLPGNKRVDILSELRSTLEDDIESRSGGEPTEAIVAAAIQEMGAPQQVAAAYHPEGQYLIGPELYPLFRMVVGIVIAAVVGAQLVAVAVAVLLVAQPVNFLEVFWGTLNSIPVSIGFVVLVFYVLQRQQVKPDVEDKVFDPYKLPSLDGFEEIKRGEHVASILAGVIFLAVFAWFAGQGGYGWNSMTGFFENPVLDRYFPWIVVSTMAGITVDIILLWRGRWQVSTRLAHIAVNLFSLGVLYFLIQGHAAWLEQAGYEASLLALARAAEFSGEGFQVIGMLGFWIGLVVAAVVVSVETVVFIFRLLLSLGRSVQPVTIGLTGRQ